MKKMTQQNLINAFGGESMAHMRYLHFANRADKDNYSNVARLFRAVSHAEYVHAGDHYKELAHLAEGLVADSMGAFGPGDTAKNLQLAVDGETFEIEEMYPTYIEVAELQEEKGAVRSFGWAFASEKLHLQLFLRAREAVEQGSDVELGGVQVCEVCGYTLEGDPPDKCPVCGAKKDKFTEFA
jgi:rubrerythrin